MSDLLEKWAQSQSNTNDVRAEQIRQLTNFFTRDENIDMKTELDKSTIARMDSSEVLDRFLKEEYGLDLGYRQDNIMEMSKLVSHRRRGRDEAISVLKQHVELVDQRSGTEKVLLG